MNRSVLPSLAALVLLNCPLSGQAQDSVAVQKLRPKKAAPGGLLARGVNKFQTPEIYDIFVDSELVNAYLPVDLEPRLERNTRGVKGKLEKVFLKPGYLRWASHVQRGVVEDRGQISKAELGALLPQGEAHTYVLSADRLSFARTGPHFGEDRVSKHAIINPDFEKARFAGQLWRSGDSLIFNGASGTYVKKRKAAGLTPAPDGEQMAAVMESIFGPELAVVYTEDFAPGFGAEEAIDQAEKAQLAADQAEKKAGDPSHAADASNWREKAAEARRMADAARSAAAAVPASETDPLYYERDRLAAEAATNARRARKALEKSLEKE